MKLITIAFGLYGLSLLVGRVAVDESFDAFLPRFEQGITQFINGDTTGLKEILSRAEDVSIMGGWGAYAKGWKEVEERADWAVKRFKNSGAKAEFEYLSKTVEGNLAWTVSIERSQAHIVDQEKPMLMVLRVTHLFRKEQGRWRLVHRHADAVTTKIEPGAVLQKP
jgi:ketosteroid isomerase-like protein